MIWFLVIWALATLGFFALASSMSKHQKQIFAKERWSHLFEQLKAYL